VSVFRTLVLIAAFVLCGCASARNVAVPIAADEAAVTAPSDQSTEPSFRYLPSAEAALLHIVSGTRPRVVAFGEYHNQAQTEVRSALARFTESMLPAMAPVTSDIVVEALVPTGDCVELEEEVAEEVRDDTERPEETENEVVALFREARARGVAPHFITLGCAEHEAIYGGEEVDYLALLELIGAELASTTEDVVDRRASRGFPEKPLVAVYGGAIHNDLAPDPAWRSVSYGPAIAGLVPPGKYVEVDLVVPEIVAQSRIARQAPWYPVFEDHVSSEQTLLIELSENSFVVVFPEGS